MRKDGDVSSGFPVETNLIGSRVHLTEAISANSSL
jgi:hypothetical protein